MYKVVTGTVVNHLVLSILHRNSHLTNFGLQWRTVACKQGVDLGMALAIFYCARKYSSDICS